MKWSTKTVDPLLVKGVRQHNTFKGEHRPLIATHSVTAEGVVEPSGLTSDGSPKEGYVATLGYHTQRPMELIHEGTPSKQQMANIGVQGTMAFLKHIFAKEFKVFIDDVEQPMKTIFPHSIRTHYGTDATHRTFILPHDGHFGLEFLVRIKNRKDTIPVSPYYTNMPLSDDLRSIGVFPFNMDSANIINTAVIGTAGAGSMTLTGQASFAHYAYHCARQLTTLCGNPHTTFMVSTGTANTVEADRYPSNTFLYLQSTLNRSATGPSGATGYNLDPSIYAKDSIEFYGYRIIDYDTDNVSNTAVTETDFTYKFGPIIKADNIYINAEETTKFSIKNVTHADINTQVSAYKADQDIYNLNHPDANPIKLRVFKFVNGPQMDSSIHVGAHYWNNYTIVGGAVSNFNPLYDRTILQTVEGYEAVQRTILSGGQHAAVVFTAPNQNGLIYNAQNGVDMVTFKEILPPKFFKNCSYYDSVVKVGEHHTVPGTFSFNGTVQNFFKCIIHIGKTFSNAGTFEVVPAYTEKYPGTSYICMAKRLETSKKSEPMPELSYNIYSSRTAVCYAKRQLKQTHVQRDVALFLTTPVNSNVVNY